MIDTNSYWQGRADKYGHTGWSDHSTYYYDQNLRIKAIKSLVDELRFAPKIALDYGCGTGEFTEVLSERCFGVLGVDIAKVVIKKAGALNSNPNVKFSLHDEDVFNTKYGLILCVTVLQHVVDDTQLLELVTKFRKSMTPCSQLVLLESFSSDDEEEGSYIKLRRYDDFLKIFEGLGFKLKSVSNFYHPVLFPTKSFVKYKSNFIVRVLNKLSLIQFPGARFSLKKIALFFSKRDCGVIFEESITKILVFEV